LSVWREVRAELPHESVWYVADAAYAPYGDKPAAVIEERAVTIASFLVDHGAKALVVACNTATGVAVAPLRQAFSVPIIGIGPAVKPAVTQTRSGVVGVLATSQTLASRKFQQLLDAWRANTTVLVQACPGLVEQIEQGALATDSTRALVAGYVTPLVEQGADTLVLGCTHYPFVADTIRAVAGPDVQILDPARAVAKEVRRRLDERGLLTTATGQGALRLYTTGDPASLHRFLTTIGLPGPVPERV
jgi:glutamate racemase